MEVKKVIVVIICLVCIIDMTCFFKKVEAAQDAEVHITWEKNSVGLGKKASVSIETCLENGISDIDAILLYDTDMLEFKYGDCCECIEAGKIRLRKPEKVGMYENQYKITFEAKNIGSTKLKFEKNPKLRDINGKWVDTYKNDEVALNIVEKINDDENNKDEETKVSSDATLAYIKINPGKLDKEFLPEEVAYNVIVENNCKSIDVQVEANDPKAEIYIDKKENLDVGLNKIIIIVTAQDKSIKKYVVSVYRKENTIIEYENAKEASVSKVDEPEKEEEEKFSVKEIDGELYFICGYNYKLIELEDDSIIPEGYKRSKVVVCNKTVTAFVKKDYKEDDFFLIYAENTDKGVKNFYKYDKLESTLQRFDEKNVEKPNDLNNLKVIQKYKRKLMLSFVTISLMAIMIILIMLFLIKFIIKSNDIKKDML